MCLVTGSDMHRRRKRMSLESVIKQRSQVDSENEVSIGVGHY